VILDVVVSVTMVLEVGQLVVGGAAVELGKDTEVGSRRVEEALKLGSHSFVVNVQGSSAYTTHLIATLVATLYVKGGGCCLRSSGRQHHQPSQSSPSRWQYLLKAGIRQGWQSIAPECLWHSRHSGG
jgi:hypothetical protein